ncbi:MAG: hypothetical protein SF182_04500 [Deltaproteobacteria bacterium]|nr:hypothetical protein [Deltaproteobacteria bacterium]
MAPALAARARAIAAPTPSACAPPAVPAINQIAIPIAALRRICSPEFADAATPKTAKTIENFPRSYRLRSACVLGRAAAGFTKSCRTADR